MKIKIIIHALLLCSFSFSHGMKLAIQEEVPLTDENLQKLIKGINDTSLKMVEFVRKQAQDNYMRVTSYTIKPLLKVDQEMLDQLFLQNIEDDEFRPLLLSMGANINAQTKHGYHCLWFTKKPELLEELILNGAIVDTPDKYNTTRLYDLLSNTAPQEAVAHIAAARVLLQYGANPNIRKTIKDTIIGNTSLINAITLGDPEFIEFMLKKHADPNTPNSRDDYPLHIAMEDANPHSTRSFNPAKPTNAEIVILLLEYKANPNRRYPFTGNMPLHVAVMHGLGAIIKKLLACGAEKHHCNNGGHTAFKLAQQECYFKPLGREIVDLLNPNPTELMGFSIADYTDQANFQTNNPAHSKTDPTQQASKGHCAQQ